MNPLENAIYPHAGAPARLASQLCSLLAELPFVRRIALFGSLAENRADGWSDVDMIVACSNVEAGAWIASKAICSAKPILFYRKFSARNEPSGRYWFAGESPFNRLDISFDSVADYQAHLDNPKANDYPITYREIYTSDRNAVAPDDREVMPFLQPASDRETRIGSYIYFSLRAIKHHLRTGTVLEKDIPRIKALREELPALSRDTVMSGGRIGELAHQAGDMLARLELI